MSFSPQTAVVGAGAVGCYFGGMLARAGVPVTLIGRPALVAAIERDGLAIDGLRVRETVRVRAATELGAARDAELILFCVKTIDTETAARALAPHLTRGSTVISLQNGVDNTDRMRAAAGVDALASVVYVAAAMNHPGRVTHSGRGDLVLEHRNGSDAIASLFESSGVQCRLSEDIRKELWTKLLMNCAYNAISALARSRYGRIAADEGARQVMRSVIEEAVTVACAEGVALDAGESVAAAYQLGETMMPGALSSTAQDIARGKRTEIDSSNGYVVRKGEDYGIATPVNRTLQALIKLLEG
jgi:2-dehydropantoate 2-reductase